MLGRNRCQPTAWGSVCQGKHWKHTVLKSLTLSCWAILCIWSQLILFHPECGPFRYRLTFKVLWVFWATAPIYSLVSKFPWTKALLHLPHPPRTLWKHLRAHSVSPTCTRMWHLEKLVDHQSCSHLCLFIKLFFFSYNTYSSISCQVPDTLGDIKMNEGDSFMGPSTLICGADFIKDFQAKEGPLQVTNANYLILNIRHYCLSKSFHYYAWGFCISSTNGQRSLAGLQSMGLQRVGHDWVMDFWYLLSPLSLSGLVFHFCPQMIHGRPLMAKDLLRQSPEQEAPTLGIISSPICPFKGKVWVVYGLFRWLRDKGSVCQCSRCVFDPWVGKIPGWGNGIPLQYSCLENSMDKGAWWAVG